MVRVVHVAHVAGLRVGKLLSGDLLSGSGITMIVEMMKLVVGVKNLSKAGKTLKIRLIRSYV